MNKLKIKESYLILLIVVSLVSLGIYTTYALFTASTTINDVVGITATLDIGKSMSEYEVVTVPAGETKLIELNVVNSYNGNIYYGAWYQVAQGNSDDIQIGLYTERNSNPGSGSLSSSSNINLLVGITNDNSTSVTLYIGVKGSLTNELNLGTNKILIPDGFSEALLVTDEVLEAHKETKTDTIEVENEINKEFSATGAVQNVTLNKGTYKLQVWGAQGGYYSPYKGGQGGYSYGTIILTESTNIYVYVGGAGSSNGTAGFNGGGSSTSTSTSIITGGGASDMRIKNNSLYARVIVAGGGGGSSYYVSGAGGNGGAGGGLSGGAGSSKSFPASGGTISSGGKTLDNHQKVQSEGSFGTGGSVDSNGGIGGSGAGGGGWYGGSGGSRGLNTNSIGSGSGGSGWVYTNENFNSWQSGNSSDASKWELNSNYYLTNAATFTGDTTFESTSGGTETGHSGNGYAKITGTEKYTTTGTVTYYTIPNLTGLTDLTVPLGTNVSLTDGTTLTCENNTTTGCSITNISIIDTSSLTEGTYVVTYTVKGANNKKYLFNRNIIVAEIDTSGANSPDLVQGLIPVVYNESTSNWVKADSTNTSSSWYNYNNKKWANAVLVSSTNRSTYQSASAGTAITESDILAYYVWIPRFKYKVWNKNKVVGTDSYNARTKGIDIVFESEKDKTGTVSCTYSYNSPSSSANSPNETCTGSNGDYYTHPAFTFGSDELRGFWIGKFELTGSSSKLTVLPNVSSLRSNTVSSFSTVIQNMQTSSNIYGLSTSRTNTDSHMLTNYEWGAVAYLTNSKYGRCTNGSCTEVTINNCSSYITGIGADSVSASSSSSTCTTATNKYNGTKGVLASTTGNITGVYDMSGGAFEYAMGNMSSASGSYTFYPSSSGFASGWYTTSTAKYVTTYANGSSETDQTAYNRGRLGDATGEVVLSTGGTGGWYSDYAHFPYSRSSWFLRGGGYYNGAYAGVFYFDRSLGGSYTDSSSRAVLVSVSA